LRSLFTLKLLAAFLAKKTDPRSIWINEVKSRRNTNIATVALANKNARIIWALLSKGESYHNAAC